MSHRRISDQRLSDHLATARLDPDGPMLVHPGLIEALVLECQAARQHFRGRGPICRELEGSELRFLKLPKAKTKRRDDVPRSTRRTA